MSAAPPPLAYPPQTRRTAGCTRAVVILIFGVLLVFVLARLTQDKDAGETAAESPSSAPSAEPLLLEVSAIVGKTPAEVERLLGDSATGEETKQGPKRIYRNGAVEIVFIGGKADWITVNPAGPLPFGKEALARLGIPAAEPSFSSGDVIRWEPCGDYASVSLFPDAGRVDYAVIKVTTK